jgi:hypothetical protein
VVAGRAVAGTVTTAASGTVADGVIWVRLLSRLASRVGSGAEAIVSQGRASMRPGDAHPGNGAHACRWLAAAGLRLR